MDHPNQYFNDVKGAIALLESYGQGSKELDAAASCDLGDLYDRLASHLLSMTDDISQAETLSVRAIACLKDAIRKSPEMASAHYRLGNLLWAESTPEALKEFQRALDLEPGNEAYVSAVRAARKSIE